MEQIESQKPHPAVSTFASVPGVPSVSLPAVGPDPASGPEARAAAARLAGQLAALTEDEVQQVNLDVPNAVAQVLGAWADVEAHLPEFEKLPQIDIARVRSLRDCALALHHWQGSSTYALRAVPPVTALAERGFELRDRTIDDLRTLASHGVLDGALLDRFGGSLAHRKLAQDLEGLANLVHEHWARIAGRSMLTLESMDEASRVAQAILQALGDKGRVPTHLVSALRQRDRAFTLLIRAYDEAQRGMTFVRWHEGDAYVLLPSLHATRRTSRQRADEFDDGERADPAELSPPTSPSSRAAADAATSDAPADEKDSLFGNLEG